MILTSCPALQFPPGAPENIPLCSTFADFDNNGDLVILACSCASYDADNDTVGDFIDLPIQECKDIVKAPNMGDIPSLRGFFLDYKLFREDLKEKAKNIKNKRIRKKVLKELR